MFGRLVRLVSCYFLIFLLLYVAVCLLIKSFKYRNISMLVTKPLIIHPFFLYLYCCVPDDVKKSFIEWLIWYFWFNIEQWPNTRSNEGWNDLIILIEHFWMAKRDLQSILPNNEDESINIFNDPTSTHTHKYTQNK